MRGCSGSWPWQWGLVACLLLSVVVSGMPAAEPTGLDVARTLRDLEQKRAVVESMMREIDDLAASLRHLQEPDIMVVTSDDPVVVFPLPSPCGSYCEASMECSSPCSICKNNMCMDSGTCGALCNSTDECYAATNCPGCKNTNQAPCINNRCQAQPNPVCGSYCTYDFDCAGSSCNLCLDATCTSANSNATCHLVHPFIRSVGYSPSPIGDNPQTQEPYGDYFTAEYAYLYERDLPLIQAMGANAIRLWYWNITADHTHFLDTCVAHNLSVIATFPFPAPNYEQLHSSQYIESVRANFTTMLTLQNHSAVVLWLIGNELNNFVPGSNGTGCCLDLQMLLIQELVDLAHVIEAPACRPVTTPLADVGNIMQIMGNFSDVVDLWAVQLYRGCNSFTDFWAATLNITHDKVIITEFGIDAYNDTGAVLYPDVQANCLRNLWGDIEDHASQLYGASIMEYSDEWWKGINLPGTCQHPDCSPAVVTNTPFHHSQCGYPDESSPDFFKNEEYWGLMALDTWDKGCLMPRPAYFTMQELWNGTFNSSYTNASAGQWFCFENEEGFNPCCHPELPTKTLPAPPSPANECVYGTLLPRNVTIVGKILYVNYEEFRVKGVMYSPAPIGADPQLAYPYGDFFTSEYQPLFERDLPLMRQMGVNTVMAQLATNSPHEEFLDACYANGISVIPSFFIPPLSTLDNSTRTDLQYDFEELVRYHTGHPAVLMWQVAGPVNTIFDEQLSNLFYLVSLLKESTYIVEGDASHPLAVDVGLDINLWQTISMYDDIVDVWNIEMYTGISFYDMFQTYYGSSKKPLLVTYGMDAYNTNAQNATLSGDVVQANYLDSLATEVGENVAVAIGGVINEWNDEWWRGTVSESGGVDCSSYDLHFYECGEPNTYMPDGFMHSQYMGLMAQTQNINTGADCVEPRPSYFLLMCVWTGNCNLLNSTAEEFCATQPGNCCASMATINRVVMLSFLFAPGAFLAIGVPLFYCLIRPCCCKMSTKGGYKTLGSEDEDDTMIQGNSNFQAFYDLTVNAVDAALKHYGSLPVAYPAPPENAVLKATSRTGPQWTHTITLILNEVLRQENNLPVGTPAATANEAMLEAAVNVVHAKLMEGYNSWLSHVDKIKNACERASPTTSTKKKIQSIFEWLLIWEMSGNLRHCPELLCAFYHNIPPCEEMELAQLKQMLQDLDKLVRAEASKATTHNIPEFHYDDLNEKYWYKAQLIEHKSTDTTKNGNAKAFPERGGFWLGVMVNFWFIFHFKMVFFVVVAILSTRDPHIVRSDIGTLIQYVALTDAGLCIFGTLLHMLTIRGTFLVNFRAQKKTFIMEFVRLGGACAELALFQFGFVDIVLQDQESPALQKLGLAVCTAGSLHISFSFVFLAFRALMLVYTFVHSGVPTAVPGRPKTREWKKRRWVKLRVFEVLFWLTELALEYLFVNKLVEPNTLPAVFYLCVGTASNPMSPYSLQSLVTCWAPRVGLIVASLLGYLVFTYVVFVLLSALIGLVAASFYKRLGVYQTWQDLQSKVDIRELFDVILPPHSGSLVGAGVLAEENPVNGADSPSTPKVKPAGASDVPGHSLLARATSQEGAGVGSVTPAAAAPTLTVSPAAAPVPAKPEEWPMVCTSGTQFDWRMPTLNAKELLWNQILTSLYNDDVLEQSEARALREGFVQYHGRVVIRPRSAEARRRLLFFLSSLASLRRWKAIDMEHMKSFTILVPVYDEPIIYTAESLRERSHSDARGDGTDYRVSDIEYLVACFPDEWQNFHGRMKIKANIEKWVPTGEKVDKIIGENPQELLSLFMNKQLIAALEVDVRIWASLRGQTLCRTVKGAFDTVNALRTLLLTDPRYCPGAESGLVPQQYIDRIDILLRTKCQVLVTYQTYGSAPPVTKEAMKILRERYPNLELAYIIENKNDGVYQSVLEVHNEVRYIVPRFGMMKIGQGKAENQNHAMVFVRGECLQTIDMNQEYYFEESLKIPHLFEELFERDSKGSETTAYRIVGFREYIFTERLGMIGRFMGNAELTFGTIVQRVLSFLSVRLHYGHPDVWDGYWAKTRGISKSSNKVHVNEDIFAGYELTLRGESITHEEFIQVGKGRETSFASSTVFESKLASGAGLQCMSREVYRLNKQLPVLRRISLLYGSLGFYVNTTVMTYSIWVFMYAVLLLSLTGHTAHQIGTLGSALAVEWFIQLGYIFCLPLLAQFVVEKGFWNGLGDFLLDLPLSTLFFVFHMRTKAYWFMTAISTNAGSWLNTGRGFGLKRQSLKSMYITYADSHFHFGLAVFSFLIMYYIYDTQIAVEHFLKTWSIVLTVVSWLFAPMIFNPFTTITTLKKEFSEFSAWLSKRPTAKEMRRYAIINPKTETADEQARIASALKEKDDHSWTVWWMNRYLKEWKEPECISPLEWRLRCVAGLTARILPWAVLAGALLMQPGMTLGPIVDLLLLVAQLFLLDIVLSLRLWRTRFRADSGVIRIVFFLGVILHLIILLKTNTPSLAHIIVLFIVLFALVDGLLLLGEIVIQLLRKCKLDKQINVRCGLVVLRYAQKSEVVTVLHKSVAVIMVSFLFVVGVLISALPTLHTTLLYNEGVARTWDNLLNENPARPATVVAVPVSIPDAPKEKKEDARDNPRKRTLGDPRPRPQTQSSGRELKTVTSLNA